MCVGLLTLAQAFSLLILFQASMLVSACGFSIFGQIFGLFLSFTVTSGEAEKPELSKQEEKLFIM